MTTNIQQVKCFRFKLLVNKITKLDISRKLSKLEKSYLHDNNCV